MKGTKEMARISLYSANKESVYGANSSDDFKGYLKGKGFLSLSKTARLMDPYFRYGIFSASKFNAKKYSGKVKFKGDPLAIQKKLRDEWK